MGNFIEFDSESGKTRAYLALPAEGNGPGVLLFHTWWGLTDFFTGLADRLAAEGFAVLAPDLYDGRTTSAIDEAKRLVNEVDGDVSIKREVAALDQLLAHPSVRGDKVGVIGLSMGAAYAVWLSALRPEVAAVVLFYGGSDWQPEGFLENTRASFLGHFAPNDEWEGPDEGVHALEAALRDAGREATFHFYPGTGHWFFEDNRPDVYNPEAAALAWERTLSFLRDKLA
jgi:carboxymethylenebutenolidase